jgi:hypothetical protein
MSQLFDMIDEDRRGPPVDFDVGQSIKTTVESLGNDIIIRTIFINHSFVY